MKPLPGPLFECVERIAGDGTPIWVFWCPYCKKEHTHSASPGHRAAHCHYSSPLRDLGYTLRKAPKVRAAAKGHSTP